MITFGVDLADKGWSVASTRVPVFIGFLVGAFFAEALKDRNKPERSRFISYTVANLILLVVCAGFCLYTNSAGWSLFFLGWFAGHELTLFRKMGITSVNNGIMTGNAKNFANSLYRFFFKHDHEAGLKALALLVAIVSFLAGVLSSAYWFGTNATILFIVAIVLNLVTLILFLIPAKESAK